MTTSTTDGRVLDVRIDLPRSGVSIAGTWRPNDAERFASWEMCVELATRVPVIPLREGEGLLSELLTSLYHQFRAVRAILRRHGPDLAASDPGDLCFAVLAGHLINQVLRPVLSYWHVLLDSWMDQKPPDVGRVEHEQAFPRHDELRRLLVVDLRLDLLEFTDAFAKAGGGNEFVRVQLDNEDRLYSHFRRLQARGSG